MSLEHSPARNGKASGRNAVYEAEDVFCSVEPEPFVNERAAAAFLGVSVRTLQRWRTEPPEGGGPPFYKLGSRRVAYRLNYCGKWAESRAFGSTSEIESAD